MEKKNKMMSSYEESCMWMSYRYCIGRKTIAASMHAHDIAVNCYKRMTDERSKFTAFDIKREIGNILGIVFNFHSSNLNEDNIIDPIFALFMFIDNYNITDLNDITKKYSYIKYGYDNDNFLNFEVTENTKETIHYDIYKTEIIDLFEWDDLSNLFDLDKHIKVITKDGSEIECFYSYRFDDLNDRNSIKGRKLVIPVEHYLKTKFCYIDKSNIKKII